VFAIDVDGDGDVDVISASRYAMQVAWYENDGNQGFTKHTITNTTDGALSVFAIDVDGDGDMDVLSTSFGDDTVAWYENTLGYDNTLGAPPTALPTSLPSSSMTSGDTSEESISTATLFALVHGLQSTLSDLQVAVSGMQSTTVSHAEMIANQAAQIEELSALMRHLKGWKNKVRHGTDQLSTHKITTGDKHQQGHMRGFDEIHEA
jgi:hypothetical protein